MSQYIYLYDYLMKCYLSRGDVAYCENWCAYAADTLEYFYDCLDTERYSYYENIDREENQKAIEALEEKVEMLLVTYGGVAKEDVAGFKDYTSAQRAMLLEEGVLR